MQQTLLAEFLQQRLDLIVLKLDDSLLAFVVPTNENGEQNVAGLEKKEHGYRSKTASRQGWRMKSTS